MPSEYKMAFLGAGVIAEVWIERLLASQATVPDRILACDPRAEQLQKLKTRWGVGTSQENRRGAEFGDIVVLATPPPATLAVIREVRPVLAPEKTLVSLAAAVSLATLEEAGGVPVVRVMPNTPSLIGEGMNLVAFGSGVNGNHKDQIARLLGVLGHWREVPDQEINRWCALCAVGPTYFLPAIVALTEAAAASGLESASALNACAQVAAGTARLVQQSGRTPEQLKQMISLRTLQEEEVSRLFAKAYDAAVQKLEGLEKKISEEQAATVSAR